MDKKIGYGEFIATHRERSGFKSQRQLAYRSGISPATISRIESEIQKPEYETLKTLAKHLSSTTFDQLLTACGYEDEEDALLTPINFKAHEAEVIYKVGSLPNIEKELPLEDLAEYKISYKGRVLTSSEKNRIIQVLYAVLADPENH